MPNLALSLVVAVLAAMLVAPAAYARPANPLQVERDAKLNKGEWFISYHYQREEGKGLRSGKDRVKPSDVVDDVITQIPVELRRDIHTVAFQYAPLERFSLLISLPIINQKMKQRDFDDGGTLYSTTSSGVGDLEVIGIIPFMVKGQEKLDVHLGLRLPTGQISRRDNVPGEGKKVLLPLSMQTGSRTASIVTGFTYQGSWRGLGWGVQGNGTIGFDNNHRGYRLGNEIEVMGWLAHDLTDWLSGSFQLGFDRTTRARRDKRSGPANHRASYRDATARKELALGPGLSVTLPGLENQRLAVEASWPVYQSLDGAQVEKDWTLTTGWEFIF